MKKPELITYKGKQVIYLDFSDLKNERQIQQLTKASGSYIQKHRINSVLVLTNIKNMYFNNELRMEFINTSKNNGPYIKASAIIGLYGLASFVFDDFLKQAGRKISVMKTKEQALEYLVTLD